MNFILKAPKAPDYTREQMIAMFERIKPKTPKGPINAVIKMEDLDLASAAVMYFTGSICEEYSVKKPGMVRIKAAG
jgi:hypothetical protein